MASSRPTRSTIAAAGGALLLGALAPGTPAQAAPAPAKLSCAVPQFDRTMDYPATVDVIGSRNKSGAAVVTLKLSAMPGIVPVAVDDAPMTGIATATVGGKNVTLTGSSTLDGIAAYDDLPTPVMSGTLSTTATSASVTISRVNFVAKHPFMDVDVNCTAVSGLTRTVTFPSVTPAAAATTSKATVKVSKKRVATVKASVAAKKVKATGKVTVTVLKGKKTVVAKSLTLKSGAATLKTKKLAKGSYSITVTYKGTKGFKASKKTVRFRVK